MGKLLQKHTSIELYTYFDLETNKVFTEISLILLIHLPCISLQKDQSRVIDNFQFRPNIERLYLGFNNTNQKHTHSDTQCVKDSAQGPSVSKTAKTTSVHVQPFSYPILIKRAVRARQDLWENVKLKATADAQTGAAKLVPI